MIINLGGNWQLYTGAYGGGLNGLKMLGTVTRDDTDTGALAQTIVGIYVQVNSGVIRTLDQRKVQIAISGNRSAGRPATLSGKRINVYLDQDSIDAATKLGNGVVSLGIRTALKNPGGG